MEDGNHIMDPKAFQQQIDDGAIVKAIQKVEAATSGEIRVYVTRHTCVDALAAARVEFGRLGMERTPLRNGVLLYFAPRSQRFAVIGDEGVQTRVVEAFWTGLRDEIEVRLRAGDLHGAVLHGVQQVGAELAQQYPKHSLDRDDLCNRVVRD